MTKKIVSLILAVLLVLAMAVPAMADIPAPTTEHDYKAYQIFSGTQTASPDTSDALGDIEWGSGVDGDKLLTALQAAFEDIFDKCKTAADVAGVIKGWADKSDNAMAFAKVVKDYTEGNGTTVVNGQTELEAGYYLVVDETAEVGEGDAYNLALLQLTKKETFEIALKNSVPEIIKEVYDDTKLVCENTDKDHKHTDECYGGYSDSNNAAIGDVVEYQITSTVPAEAVNYKYYYFIIRDTLSTGLELVADSFEVKIGGTKVTTGYTLKTGDDAGDYSFQIALVDAKANAGKNVVVTYKATVTDEVEIGETGNPNTADLQYSNKPDFDYNGTPDEDDGFPKEEDVDAIGETPEDYTITYTTELKVFKVDGDNNPLAGAEFTLSGDTLNKVIVVTDVYEVDNTNGTYYKLLDGTYTTTAPTSAATYRAATEADGRDGGYVLVNGEYKVATKEQLEDTTVQLYIKVNDSSSLYDGTDKYKKTTNVETTTDAGTAKEVAAFVNSDGVVVFEGLSAGTYTLTETKIPAGYNPIAPITFTIDWDGPKKVVTGKEKCTWTLGTDEDSEDSGVAYMDDDEAFEVTIENLSGTTLPETGGIGTRIFYALGSLLLVGAAVLLITKKRMSVND